ncbi:hypothetical protein K2Z83_10670 [Oscillochloris sp. ZM17-4]|uniref:hypothetical protein n=1 Tax=Oscillochloris sp. ZM17-4 TaxID=2866714 RepID=UPI001C73C53F|nr:hypothetical protein [Oscillochloris sp. ZM17-4]MBX0328141.1 hypothetical protein [Oscillochloris sp. ZM17-4]
MAGRFCRVEPLDLDRHAADLHAANLADAEGRMWTYLAYGPFGSLDDYLAWAGRVAGGDDPLFHAIIDGASGRAVGLASYLMRRAFALGYPRESLRRSTRCWVSCVGRRAALVNYRTTSPAVLSRTKPKTCGSWGSSIAGT